METKDDFRTFLANRKIDENRIQAAEETINLLKEFYMEEGKSAGDFDAEVVKAFSARRIAGREDAFDRIVALIWHCQHQGQLSEIPYYLTMLGTRGVLESMKNRTKDFYGEIVSSKIFEAVAIPPLGALCEEYPSVVRSLLENMQHHLTCEQIHCMMAGNHHHIPLQYFEEQRKKFYELNDIDAFLQYRHEKMLGEMEEAYQKNRFWYEQRVTPVVLDFVKSNQEFQSGVRSGRTVFLTKIPYNPDAYMAETNPVRKRFYACHCGLVRFGILNQSLQIPSLWCSCSAGFEKLAFDVIFDQSLEIEMLESVLRGDMRCRFALKLPSAYCDNHHLE